MKKINILLFASLAIFLTACSDDTESSSGSTAAPAESTAEAPKEKKILYWVAPMDPTYRRDEPGKSPMGMDLVPVYDEGDEGSAVKISPAVENNMGVRTAKVVNDRLWRRIDTVGYVDFDENKISHIHLRTKGWIEKLYVKSEGERVKKGQLLFEVYAPELVNAQEEYVQALRSHNKGLTLASRERLIALGISPNQIDQLNRTRKVRQYVRVYAKQNGIIAKLNIREGMFVMPQKLVMSLADLSSVWLLAEVFEKQVDWVKEGQSADVTLSYLPGRVWEGKVEYIYPSLDQKTRTLKVRLKFENKDESLKPNMFANVTIYGGASRKMNLIPREALIRSGNEERVILALGDGRFEPRAVVAGIESGDWIAIIKGLHEGDTVVTSGQFLIDSEASLKASMARMTSPEPAKEENTKQEQATTASGMGTVVEIDSSENKIKLEHEPIEALDWPAMTMFFNVKDGLDIGSLKKGDMIGFELEKTDDGYVIKSFSKHSGM